MKEIQAISLLCLSMAAVLFDLKEERIPNSIIMTGVLCGGAYQLFLHGMMGITIYLGGVLLPILLFGWFYYFRMIGAGDVKLMCAIGGFLGPSSCFSFIAVSVLFAGLISLGIMVRRHNFSQRLMYFAEFVSKYSTDKQWLPYIQGVKPEARFCFAVPVLGGVLYYIGGMI